MIVSFNDITSKQLGLIIVSRKINAPVPKTSSISIDGRDGVIDLTDYFGEVRYNNMKISLDVVSINPSVDVWNDVKNKLNGKKFKVRFNDEAGYYYNARVLMNQWKRSKAIGTFSIDLDCEPYKLKENVTTITSANNTTKVFVNDMMPTTPTFTLAGTTKITFGDYSVQLSAGKYKIPAIEFKQGNNEVTFEGSGNIIVEYQEGAL